MLKTKIITFSICVVAGFSPAMAQFDSLNFSANGKNFLENNNASLINQTNIASVSKAEVFAIAQKNGFRNYNQAAKSISAGADVQSFYKFNSKVSGYGKISYENFTGKDMHGSVFIFPEQMPFDIVEQADTNCGKKNLEKYNIIGAIGAKVLKDFSVGVKFDYITANYAKRKDLRHKNSLMDLSLSAGISYDFGFIQTGANYIYRRRNESIKFNTFGTADKTYNSIISYAVFWGLREEFGTEGFTDKSREMPLFDQYNGFNYQFLINISPKIQWFNDFGLSWRDGKYGRKGQYTIEYEKHNSDIINISGSFFIKSNKLTQSINYNAKQEKLNVFRNIYTSETFEGGLTNYIYHDKLKISQKQNESININYNLLYFSNFKDLNQIWDFNISTVFNRRATIGVVYPFYRRQDIKTKELSVSLSQTNYTQNNTELKFTIGGAMKKGSGHPYIDGWYVEPNYNLSNPPESTVCIFEEYEYLCKPHIDLNAAAKIARKMFSESIKGYISIKYNHTQAKNTIYLKNTANTIAISIGAEF